VKSYRASPSSRNLHYGVLLEPTIPATVTPGLHNGYMTSIVVLISVLAGIALGGVVVALASRDQRRRSDVAHEQHLARATALYDDQTRQLAQAQQAAVQAAVREVLSEREATATHTAAAVTADREKTVAAAVENAVRVASAQLDSKLKQSSAEFDLRSSAFNDQVQGITGQLDRVTGLVSSLQKDKAQQHGQLVTQLQAATTQTEALHDTTSALREVLANPKSRGQWGERMADDVLQAAGFREGINYRKQQMLAGGGIPDFTFLLPRGLHLHMDVKFPVDNYVRFLEAKDDLERDKCRSAFARDVRARIREVRDRGYIDPETTVDTLLMFIPNESVYAFVHENDADIIDLALKEKVVLCSPLTMFSVLAIVRQAVDNFRLERRSSEILDYLVEFRSEWEKFSGHLDKTGRQLETFTRSFEALGSTRRNVLDRKLRGIDALEAEQEGRAELVPLGDPETASLDEPDTGSDHDRDSDLAGLPERDDLGWDARSA
jgi:DNA recombination protein RmuC